MWAHITLRVALCTAILTIADPGGVRAQTVSGTVFDSIGSAPLADAAVFLWDTPYRAVSDADGRFHMENVPPGRYSILFFHTRLGELGISPGARELVVGADGLGGVSLATPSMGTVVSSQCLMEERPTGAAAMAGWVTDRESGLRLQGSDVTLAWTDEDGHPRTRVVRSGQDGWYYTCNVPTGMPLLASASFFDRESPRREVHVEADGFLQASFQVGPTHPSHVSGHIVDAATGNGVSGAEVWIRGTRYRGLTSRSGGFELDDVAPGTYMLAVDHIAYGVKMDTLVVPGRARLDVEMRVDTRPIPIAPLTVTVDAYEPISAGMSGGIRITTEQIDRVRQQSRDASDIIRSLHLPGVIVRHQSNGTICVGYITGQVKMNQTGCVEMIIFINDVRATDSDLALRLPPDAIERMVIYKPVEAGILFGLGAGNGVWMIYTKGN